VECPIWSCCSTIRGLNALPSPYGSRLVDLLVPHEQREELLVFASGLPSVQLSERQTWDLELLATGGFSPLDRFMGKEDYQRVVDELRLSSGHLFPIPVTLQVRSGTRVSLDQEIALRDSRNEILATMRVEEVFEWSLDETARAVLGTQDVRHPLVAEMHGWGGANLSGPLRVLRLPRHYDFRELRLTPAETRRALLSYNRPNVVAFQTRNPLHRVHEDIAKRAIEEVNGVLLLHPVVGMTKPGDVDHYTRVRTYRTLASRYFREDRILLALLPLAMRLAGPREALWHALIRRNYGANHMIVGRDHASPGNDSTGRPFYGPYDAQELVHKYESELGVKMIPFRELRFLPDEQRYEELSRIPPGAKTACISGSQAREEYLDLGKTLPGWFTRPEVARILAEAYPPRWRQGACIWMTGLSGAGKSTTAEILTIMLLEQGRQVTLLDGDVVRTNLSKGLGFTREDRDTNIRRIGFVASEIVRHGGTVICAAVSPYRATRNDVRNMMAKDRFVEVYFATPLEVCEQRDAKGLYMRARSGEIPNFTGISDPYEAPEHAEVTVDASKLDPEDCARRVLCYLQERGFLVRSAP
jgi:sulfate adenylyltransferase